MQPCEVETCLQPGGVLEGRIERHPGGLHCTVNGLGVKDQGAEQRSLNAPRRISATPRRYVSTQGTVRHVPWAGSKVREIAHSWFGTTTRFARDSGGGAFVLVR